LSDPVAPPPLQQQPPPAANWVKSSTSRRKSKSSASSPAKKSKAASDLVAATRINHGDHVVSGDWIGVVEEVFEMAMIELGDSGTVRRVCDIGNTFSVGTATDTIKQMLLERGEGILAMFLGASDFKRVNPFRSLPSFKSPPVG
jgi:hypothetical protein